MKKVRNSLTWFSHGSGAALAPVPLRRVFLFYQKSVLRLEVLLSERMRRGRAPSRTPSLSRDLFWDNPDGQLPGTGVPGEGGDSLYRSSTLRRRRDASPVSRAVEGVASESATSGQESASAGAERPSLFSTAGSSSFNPFSTVSASKRPEERVEADLKVLRVFGRSMRLRGCLQSS